MPDITSTKIPTPIGDLTVVRAEPSDLEEFLRVLEEAEKWLADKGIKQWPIGTNRQHAQFFLKEIEKRVLYFARKDRETIAVFILAPPSWLDKKLWEELSEDAFYIHRLTVRPPYTGSGVGSAILQWAERVSLSHGKRYLRLNCQSENHVLCRYFEKAGFSNQGRVGGQGWTVSLFEKSLR